MLTSPWVFTHGPFLCKYEYVRQTKESRGIWKMDTRHQEIFEQALVLHFSYVQS